MNREAHSLFIFFRSLNFHSNKSASLNNYLPGPTSLGESNKPSSPQLWELYLYHLDHHQFIFIFMSYLSSSHLHLQVWIIINITASAISINWCYLSIILVIGSSTEAALFHAVCRPSLYVGLLQCLYLTLS